MVFDIHEIPRDFGMTTNLNNNNPEPCQDLLQYPSSPLCLMLIYDLAI